VIRPELRAWEGGSSPDKARAREFCQLGGAEGSPRWRRTCRPGQRLALAAGRRTI